MAPRLATALLLALTACTGTDGKTDGGDSAADTGADSGGDSGSDSGGDSGGGPTTAFALSVTTELTGALGFELTELAGGPPPTPGATYAHGAITDGTAAFDVPTPSSAPVEFDATRHPGLYGVVAALAVYEDDGDGVHGDDETYVGLARGAFWYLVDPLPEADATAGFVTGWNHAVPSEDASSDVPDDLGAIVVETALVARESMTLSGERVEVDAAARLAVVPYLAFNGGSVASLVYDAPLSAPLELTLDGPPPADHLTEPQPGLLVASELPLPYLDSDASGGWTDGDAKAGVLCTGAYEVAVAWYEPPTDLGTAWAIGALGVVPGWNALTIGEDRLVPVPEEAFANASVVPTCSKK